MISRSFGAVVALLAAGVGLCLASPGFAGSGNVLYLIQDSGTAGGAGDSFQSDQASSINSSIGTPLNPIEQSGEANSASVTIDSNCTLVSTGCGHVALDQNDFTNALAAYPKLASAIGPYVSGNSATVAVTGSGSAAVTQLGFGNDADLSVDGALGSINQIGLDNQASLSVTTTDGSSRLGEYALNQIGADNFANLAVTALGGTHVSYTQFGSGLSVGTAATPATVVTTTHSVSVVQTNY